MSRHHLRDAVWASLHAKLGAIPGIWKSDTERLRRFVEAVVYILRSGVAWGPAGAVRQAQFALPPLRALVAAGHLGCAVRERHPRG